MLQLAAHARATFIVAFAMLAAVRVEAAIYHCFAKDQAAQGKPYEVEVGFSPPLFKVTSFFKGNSGRWKAVEKVLLDGESVREPMPVRLADCQTSLNQENDTSEYLWSFRGTGSGEMTLDLRHGTGRFSSAYSLGGGLSRSISFFGCKAN